MRNINKVLLLLLSCILLFCIATKAETGKYFYVFQDGKVIYKQLADSIKDVNAIADESDKLVVNVFGLNNEIIYSANGIDSTSYNYYRPTADLLDIQFNADGTVTDISPMNNSVTVVSPTNDNKIPVYFSNTYKSYVGQLWNNYGSALGDKPVYCKVDYANNPSFLNALKAGHTLECLFRLNYPQGGMRDAEIKPFSSHQAGGTGIMICTKSRGLNAGNEITFLPNVSEDGSSKWKWGVSGVVPQDSVYYHVVGVWDKDASKAYIYVNGELKNTIAAAGELHLNASASYHWFGVGCDAGNGVGESGAQFDIVNARVYSKVLAQTDVTTLWNEMAGLAQNDNVVTPVYNIEPEPIDTTKTENELLLDIKFNNDGTAYDASPQQLTVQTINKGGVSTYYNNTYKQYVASFNNPWGSTPSGYYKVDYESNAAIKQALQDGHSMECLVMPRFSALGINEVKPFASHQAGGTGFLVCNPTSSGSTNQFTFLPNVSTTGSSSWKWAISGVTPESNTYYHLIGVWNKEEGKAYIYINGELKNAVNAQGNLNLPSSGANWFGIGCDAAPGSGTNAWCGDIVTARVYNNTLTSTQVDSLWNIVKALQDNQEPDMITNYGFLSGLAVNIGATFPITGNGFQDGDSLQLSNLANTQSVIKIPLIASQDQATLIIPEQFASGSYRMNVLRGEKKQDIGICTFTVTDKFPKGAQVIAHRGFWTKDGGTSQNSRLALRNALDGNFYGSETDVWISADGVPVVNHDASIGGVTIQTSPASALANVKLSNGETVPTLEDYLNIMDASQSPTKLIIEIKTHSTLERNNACCDSVVSAVKRHKLEDRVEYIAYSISNCRRLVANDSTAMVQYLNGDKGPQELYSYGVMGLDYTKAQFKNNPAWVSGAHKRQMVTNAYTIDSDSEIAEVCNMGIDFVTTNLPDRAQAIYLYYKNNQPADSEALAALKACVEECDNDTIDYSSPSYDQQTVATYLAALTEAKTAIRIGESTDSEYDNLRNNLIQAKEGIQKVYAAADVNRDGETNSADVVAIYNYIMQGNNSGITTASADVNKDGEVSSADVVAIYNFIATP